MKGFEIVKSGFCLLLFPLLEIGFFGLAYMLPSAHFMGTLCCLLLAAIAMSYALHISFHEVVHHRLVYVVGNYSLEIFISLLMGMPFEHYRLSHWKHHKYTNRLPDPTSTWEATATGVKACNFWLYTFGWPRKLFQMRRATHLQHRLSDRSVRHLFLEGSALVIFHFALGVYWLELWLLYLGLIYLGWAGIAAINYMQHPPIHYGSGYTTSIYRPIYNWFFYNNGLHYEHHTEVYRPIAALEPRPGKHEVACGMVAKLNPAPKNRQ